MKKRIFCGILVACMAMTAAFAQKGAFRIQGHERPDLKDRLKPAVTAVSKAEQDNSFTFSDIKFWVGKGSKCAALVVDWHDEKLDHALVWGYRFDGEATGYDMVAAVAKADPRFTFLTHATNLGNTVAGLGFNHHMPYQTEIIYAKDGDTVRHRPQNGIVTTDAYNYDNWFCSDTLGLWKSGWYTNGYWSYQVKDRMPDEFTYSGSGASSRVLTDSCVDGWSFASLSGTTEGSLPRMPYEAVFSTVEPTEDNAYWGQMYKNAAHQSVVDFPLALAPNHFSVKWEYNFGGYSGQPIVVGDYLYNTTGKKICKISLADGSLMAEQQMVGSIGYFSMIAYGDGKIFVALGSGLMQAFDAVTLKPLWQSKVEVGGQQLCPIVYHDGYVYTGTWNGGSPATGVYYCLSTADDDPQAEDEIKTPVWQSPNTGFYWSGGSIVGDCIFVGGDDGVMRSYNRRTGKIVDEWEVAPDVAGSTIRSGTSYDEKTGRLFFTGKESRKIYSVKIKADGTFDEASRLSTDIAGQATTTPTVYNGRVYATSGTMTSGGGLDVFNAETLEKLYSVDMGGISQSTPVVCTAFATEENKHEVYVYVCLNNAQGSIVCIKDFEGNTEPIVQYKWQAPKTQYCTHSVVVDQYGTLYYKNDSRGFWALSSQGISVIPSVAKLKIGGELALQTRIVSMSPNKNVGWASTNPSVATVDKDGVIKGIAAGEAKIVVRMEDGGFTDTCLVQVFTPLTALNLVDKQVSMNVGDDSVLRVNILPAGSTEDLVWTSTNPSVATVDDQGLVKALAVGESKIAVGTTDGRITDTCRLATRKVDVAGVQFAEKTVTVGARGLQLVANVLPENATNKNLIWTSTDESVLEVDEEGYVSPLKAGMAKIAVKTEEGEFTDTCVVTSDIIEVTGVSLNKDTMELAYKGSNERLTATITPSNASIKTVSYESTDETVATVNSYGWVNPQGIGSAKIIVRTLNGNFTDTCEVEVKVIHVSGVTLNKDTIRLENANTQRLTATVAPASVTNKTLMWESSNEMVAKVSNGTVTPVGNGQAFIIVKTEDGGFTDTCVAIVSNVIVKEPVAVTGVNITKNVTLTMGGSGRMLVAKVLPDTATNKNVSWFSTDTTVAKVSFSGAVTAIAPGQANIVVKTEDGGFSDTCKVMVRVAATGVMLNKTDAELAMGGTSLQLTAMVMPENATNKNVSWLSTDTTVAKVSVSGAVTAIAPGQAKIVVKTEDGGFTDTCAVTVTKEPDFSFDDIKTWVGEGSKRAALVVDWNSDKKDHALVWGYRFDGEATGYDMLAAVAKADPRFVLLKEESIYGATIGGIAYNDHTPYQTRLLYNDSVYVPVDGVVTADSSNYGDWSCSDETALWQAEHWTVGYWSYYVKDRIEDDFGYAQTGISGRTLTDGSVDGLSFITSNPAVGGLPRMPYEFVEPCAPDTTRTEIAVTGVTLNKTEDSLYIGESLQLTAVVAPADATDKTCTWASSDESVASVSATGLVTALKAGEAIITVTTVDGGFTATCRIKVTEKVGIDEHQPLAITVYPNPTASDFSLQTEEPVLMEVFTANGQRIISRQIATGTHTFKLERSGLYFVRVSTGNRSEVKRLVRL